MSEKQSPIAILAEPNGAIAEAYRNLRVTVSKHLSQGQSTFCIVSAWPGDGKSMVCTNLAVALGQLHLKVLLLDGDLRRPTISRVFSAHEKLGFTDCLDQGISLSGYKTKISNLHIMPRGVCEKNPANLLNPERLQRVLMPLKDEYDAIVMDTPPLSACSDALLMGGVADSAIMVVSPKGWDGEAESRYKQQLLDHEITLIGAVLNGAGGSERYGYGYGYGYGGGYGNYGVYGQEEGKKKRSRSKKSGFRWPWTRPDSDD